MKKLILQRDHETGGVLHKAGAEIEVSDAEYKFIMEYYMRLRSQDLAALAAAEAAQAKQIKLLESLGE